MANAETAESSQVSEDMRSLAKRHNFKDETVQCLAKNGYLELGDLINITDDDLKEMSDINLAQRGRIREAVRFLKSQAGEEIYGNIPVRPKRMKRRSVTPPPTKVEKPELKPMPAPVPEPAFKAKQPVPKPEQKSPTVPTPGGPQRHSIGAGKPESRIPDDYIHTSGSEPHDPTNSADGQDSTYVVPVSSENDVFQEQQYSCADPPGELTGNQSKANYKPEPPPERNTHQPVPTTKGQLTELLKPILFIQVTGLEPDKPTNEADFVTETYIGNFIHQQKTTECKALKITDRSRGFMMKNALTILAKLKFPDHGDINVVSVLGFTLFGDVPGIVLPIRSTCLLSALKADQPETITLLEYALDMAKGLKYIHKSHIVMVDGPRVSNCWLQHGKVRIGGFLVAKNEQHHKSKSVQNHELKDALSPYLTECMKYMSLEWMNDKDYGKLNFQSDVWTYGVGFWETMSKGKELYPDLRKDDDFATAVRHGERMKAPDGCPPEVLQSGSRTCRGCNIRN